MTNIITISTEQLKDFYDQFIPIANSNFSDGTALEQDIRAAETAGIDLFLTERDMIAFSSVTDEKIGISLNGVWYGKTKHLQAIYAKAVALDREDGSFDGVIQTDQAEFEIELGQGVLDFDWEPVVAPYLGSILPITTTSLEGDWEGTFWILDKEDLGDGQYRYYGTTNAHVVDKDARTELRHLFHYKEGEAVKEVELTLGAVDHAWDISFLYFDSSLEYTVIPTDSETPVNVGDELDVIGNQFGSDINQSFIKVGATDSYRNLNARLIQSGGSASNGSSGGPVLSQRGSAVAMHQSSKDRNNYAIPIEYILQDYQQYRTEGRISHGYIDFSTYSLSKQELVTLGIDEEKYTYGLLVSHFPQGGVVDQSKLRRNDIILECDGKLMPDKKHIRQFWDYIYQKSPGDEVEFTVFRDGKYKKIKITLGIARGEKKQTYHSDAYGFIVKELDADEKRDKGFSDNPPGLLLETNNQKGDNENWSTKGLLYQVNQTPIESIDDLREYLRETKDTELLFFYHYWKNGSLATGRLSYKNKEL